MSDRQSSVANPPPRRQRASPSQGPSGSLASPEYGPAKSWHHSQAFPAISKRPHALGLACPTGCDLSPEFDPNQANSPEAASSSPKKNFVAVPARHAYSHSASVGSRTFRL